MCNDNFLCSHFSSKIRKTKCFAILYHWTAIEIYIPNVIIIVNFWRTKKFHFTWYEWNNIFMIWNSIQPISVEFIPKRWENSINPSRPKNIMWVIKFEWIAKLVVIFSVIDSVIICSGKVSNLFLFFFNKLCSENWKTHLAIHSNYHSHHNVTF